MASTIKIRFIGDATQLSRTLGLTQRKLDKFSRSVKLGAGVALAAIAAGVAKSVASFAKFDQALTQSQAIMGELSTGEMADMEKAARAVGLATTFSASEAADSFYYLASAGLDAAQSIRALPAVATFAQAGMFDMATATDLLTDAQSALGLASDDAATHQQSLVDLGDLLVGANTLANASVQEFSAALTNKAGPAMRAYGITAEEGVAVLSVLADQGEKGEKAGTLYAAALRNLTTQAVLNTQAFDDMGVAVFDNSGNLNNMADIVEDLEVAFGDLSVERQKAALLELGFADKAQATLLALLGNSKAIREYEADLGTMGGKAQEVADKQLESLSSKWKLLRSQVEDLAIALGGKLAPAVEEATQFFGDLLSGLKRGGLAGLFASMREKSELLVPALVGVSVAMAAASVAAIVLAGSMTAVHIAASPLTVPMLAIGVAVVAVAAAAAYAYQEFEWFRVAANAVAGVVGVVLVESFKALVEPIKAVAKTGVDVLGVLSKIPGLGFLAGEVEEVSSALDGVGLAELELRNELSKDETAFKQLLRTSMLAETALDRVRAELIEVNAAARLEAVARLCTTFEESANCAERLRQRSINMRAELVAAGDSADTIRGKFLDIFRVDYETHGGFREGFIADLGLVAGSVANSLSDLGTKVSALAFEVGKKVRSGFKSGISGLGGEVKKKMEPMLLEIDKIRDRGVLHGISLGQGVVNGINWGISTNRVKWPTPPGGFGSRPHGHGRSMATGAWVTEPTLAVVGDAPGEGEIVSPESKMREIVREESGGKADGGPLIGTVNMNSNADISDLSRELRWISVTHGVAA